MTDDWKVPDDLADRVANANYADAWRLEIERTAQVRGILTDLIAELKEMPDHGASGEFLATLAAEYETKLGELK